VAILKTVNLTKIYHTSARKNALAVDDVSLEFEGGKTTGLLGPNGAGKTTLIKMMCGLVLPTRGRILVDGQDLLASPQRAYRMVGVVLEGNRNIYWRFTVKENLEYFGTLRRLTGKHLRRRIEEILEFIDLRGERNVLGKDLSRGMQQRVGIGLALLHDPQILLLDEPMLGLDVYAARTLRAKIQELASQGRVVIISTHNMRDAEGSCDAVAIMNRGRVVAYDTVRNLLDFFSTSLYSIEYKGALTHDQIARVQNVSSHVAVQDGVIQVLVEEPATLYRIVEILKETWVPIMAVEEKTDLEGIFIALTRAGRAFPELAGQFEGHGNCSPQVR
jgi:ABC-2 type transport system ATP-binding protein